MVGSKKLTHTISERPTRKLRPGKLHRPGCTKNSMRKGEEEDKRGGERGAR